MGRKFKRVIEKDGFDALPEHDKELYDEKEGKYHFNALALTENEQALANARNEAANYRTKNVALTQQLEAFKGLDAAKIQTELAELEALRAEKEAGDGKNDKKFEAAVEARVKVATAPLRTELEGLKRTNADLQKANEGFIADGEKRLKHDAMREACVALQCDKDVYAGRFPAALRWAEENAVIQKDSNGKTIIIDKETGLPLKDALKHYQEEGQFSSWWGSSGGGGADGTNPSNAPVINPWTAENWNISKQGVIYNQDPKRAAALAKAAGVDVDAPFHPKLGPREYKQFDY